MASQALLFAAAEEADSEADEDEEGDVPVQPVREKEASNDDNDDNNEAEAERLLRFESALEAVVRTCGDSRQQQEQARATSTTCALCGLAWAGQETRLTLACGHAWHWSCRELAVRAQRARCVGCPRPWLVATYGLLYAETSKNHSHTAWTAAHTGTDAELDYALDFLQHLPTTTAAVTAVSKSDSDSGSKSASASSSSSSSSSTSSGSRSKTTTTTTTTSSVSATIEAALLTRALQTSPPCVACKRLVNTTRTYTSVPARFSFSMPHPASTPMLREADSFVQVAGCGHVVHADCVDAARRACSTCAIQLAPLYMGAGTGHGGVTSARELALKSALAGAARVATERAGSPVSVAPAHDPVEMDETRQSFASFLWSSMLADGDGEKGKKKKSKRSDMPPSSAAHVVLASVDSSAVGVEAMQRTCESGALPRCRGDGSSPLLARLREQARAVERCLLVLNTPSNRVANLASVWREHGIVHARQLQLAGYSATSLLKQCGAHRLTLANLLEAYVRADSWRDDLAALQITPEAMTTAGLGRQLAVVAHHLVNQCQWTPSAVVTRWLARATLTFDQCVLVYEWDEDDLYALGLDAISLRAVLGAQHAVGGAAPADLVLLTALRAARIEGSVSASPASSTATTTQSPPPATQSPWPLTRWGPLSTSVAQQLKGKRRERLLREWHRGCAAAGTSTTCLFDWSHEQRAAQNVAAKRTQNDAEGVAHAMQRFLRKCAGTVVQRFDAERLGVRAPELAKAAGALLAAK